LHWGVAVIVFMLGFLVFSMGWMGGGDGKLAAVGALWFGPQLTPSFIILSFIFGGFMVLAVIVLRSITLPGIVERQAWLMQWVRGKEGLPFGLAMAGAVLTLIQVEF
jgi:prepilin peptidase CpaA